MEKILSHPLFVLLIFEICVLGICWIRLRRGGTVANCRRPIAALSIAVVLLTLLSMPVVGQLLQKSLTLQPSRDAGEPEYVVVLAGGLEQGTSPDLDVLALETSKRLLYAIRYWNMHRSARIVMTGGIPGQDPGRITELMAEFARCRGVPMSSIILEPQARNTREHPIRIRALPGFKPTTRLAIVTSGYHERRAIAEFRRYFQYIDPQPVPATRYYGLWNWLPDNRGLVQSTAAMQEWAGIVWYRIRN